MATLWQCAGVWRLKGAQLALQKAIAESRDLMIKREFERLEREFQALDQLSQLLSANGRTLKRFGGGEAKRTHALANQVAAYYQRYGELKRRLDADLLAADVPASLRTGQPG